MKPFFVYILKCNDDSYYIGHTDDIEKRISEHELNIYHCYTSTRLPIKIMYVQTFGTRDEALASERQLKKWSRKKKEALIEENWSKISILAKKKFNPSIHSFPLRSKEHSGRTDRENNFFRTILSVFVFKNVPKDQGERIGKKLLPSILSSYVVAYRRSLTE